MKNVLALVVLVITVLSFTSCSNKARVELADKRIITVDCGNQSVLSGDKVMVVATSSDDLPEITASPRYTKDTVVTIKLRDNRTYNVIYQSGTVTKTF